MRHGDRIVIEVPVPASQTEDGREGWTEEVVIPSCWAICGSCDGEGQHSRGVERDGGGFTSSEWAEEDQEFQEGYFRGVYDASCEDCGGSGKVREADETRMSPELLAAWYEHQESEASYAAECAAERRMGA